MHKDIDFRVFARGVATTARYARNEVIFSENYPAQFMYIVLSGAVELSSHGKVRDNTRRYGGGDTITA